VCYKCCSGCVCMCLCVCVRVFSCVCVCQLISLCMCKYACAHVMPAVACMCLKGLAIATCVRMCVIVWHIAHVPTHSHTCAHTRTHTDIHTHARTRIYTRTHLNTQTHAPPHQALLVALHLHPNRMCLSITHSLLIILPCCFILFVSGQTQPCQNVPEIFRAHTCCSRKLLARTASALMQKPKHALLPALKHAQQENTQHEHACAARLHTAPADETCSRPCAAYTGAA